MFNLIDMEQSNGAWNTWMNNKTLVMKIRFSKVINFCIKYKSYINDEKLSEFSEILLNNIRSRSVLDIHSDNIMIRQTPHGPQLVITDPLA
jgi:hypothetical protein